MSSCCSQSSQSNLYKVCFHILWCFCVSVGIWIKSSWAQVQRKGNQLSLTYIVPQLGYWVAAMSSLHTGKKIHRHKLNLLHKTHIFVLSFMWFTWLQTSTKQLFLWCYNTCLCNRSNGCEGHQHVPHCVSVGHTGRHGSHPALSALPPAVLLQVCETLCLYTDYSRSFQISI